MTDPDRCDLLCLDLPKAEAIRRVLPAVESLELWAQHGKAVGDATRLAILLALRDGGRCCVCDLAWVVGKDDKLISHHVRLLKGSGVARSTREGRMVMYELTDIGRALIDAFLSVQGARA